MLASFLEVVIKFRWSEEKIAAEFSIQLLIFCERLRDKTILYVPVTFSGTDHQGSPGKKISFSVSLLAPWQLTDDLVYVEAQSRGSMALLKPIAVVLVILIESNLKNQND